MLQPTTSTEKKLTLAEANISLRNIGLPLRAHQIEGVETILGWYEKGHSGILADEMGLGKTCQAIVSVSILLSRKDDKNAHILIICPLSVIDHWENEIKRFSVNRLKVFRYYGSKEKREEMRRKLLHKVQWNVLLTTFEIFLADSQSNLLHFDKWDFAIFDEAHRIKNDMSLLHRAVNSANIEWLLLMTGTPIQNNMPELYSLLKLVDPKKFPPEKADEFMAKYSSLTKDAKVEKEFRAFFDEFCLRRNKRILEDVPKSSEVILYHAITKLQYDIYKALLSNNRDFFLKQTNSITASRQSLMSVLVQLRKCVLHPYLFTGIEPEPYTEGEHLIAASGKVRILDRLLTYLKQKGHRVLIFSQMKRFLDIVHDILLLRGYNFEQLDGSTKTDDRLRAVENFQRTGSDIFAFLLTTKAGGLGLNLTAADTAIFLDWDFNPQNDKQAAARCHRIGQDKPVKIIRLVAKHTVEELIKYRASKKLKLSESVLGTNEKEGPTSQADFANLLIEGLKELEEAQAEISTESYLLSDEQLEDKIGKTQPNGHWEVQMDADQSTEKDDEEETAVNSMYMFEGRDYSKDRETFERILQRNKPEEEGDDEQAQLVQKIARSTRTTANSDFLQLDGSSRKIVRTKMTEEEMEERRRKRREQEILRREKAKYEKENRKRQLWAENNYITSNLPLPENMMEEEEEEKEEAFRRNRNGQQIGNIFDVQGDVTKPERAPGDNSPIVLILQTVDDGGHFGVGGVFTALRDLNERIPAQYELAARMTDLHRGDTHLIENISVQTESMVMDELNPDQNVEDEGNRQMARSISVALMVVQSVKDRYTKMISLPSLRKCLHRVQHYATQHRLTSVHMPQLWFGVQNLDEVQVRRLVDHYLCSHAINVYIYKYRRPGGGRRRVTATNHKQMQKVKVRSPSPSTPSPHKRKSSSTTHIEDEPRKRMRLILEEESDEDEEKGMEEEEQDWVLSESENWQEEDDEESDFETEEEESDESEDGKGLEEEDIDLIDGKKPRRKKAYGRKGTNKHQRKPAVGATNGKKETDKG